jgi:hypothetical protein
MPARKPNKRSSIYLGSDRWWHGWVTIGIKDDGTPDRRHRKARTEAAVTRKVRELERTRDSGYMPGAGRPEAPRVSWRLQLLGPASGSGWV